MAHKSKNSRRSKGGGSVFATQNGKYKAQLTIGTKEDGSPKKITHTCDTKTEAQEWLRKKQIELSTGELTVKGDIKFYDYTSRWMNRNKKRRLANVIKAKTFAEYEQVTNSVLLPQFGSISLNKLDTNTIDAFLQDKTTAGYAPKTVKKYKTVLHNIFGQAFKEGIINRNPVDYCMAIRQKQVNRNIIAKEDISRILAEAKAISDKEKKFGRSYGQSFFCYPILMTAYHTGMRIGEIFALRWDNIDLDNRIIHVKENISEAKDEKGRGHIIQDTPKTVNSVRDIDISETLCKVLSEIRIFASPNNGIVFSTKSGTYIAPTNFARVWRKLLKNIGMQGKYKIHEFRHTHATMLIAKGINIVSVSKRLGHASTQTTLNVYAHPMKSDGRLMAEIFEEDED